MNRLLKKEIKLVPVPVLNMRYCRILERAETMDAKDIPVADAKEILWIEDELRRRLISYVGHDFYPPDRIEKEPPSNYMISLLKSAKPKPEPGIKIKFRAVIKSSLGSKVAEVSVEADSKIKADILIRKEIRKLGLTGTTYKLS
ncbi:hypothetical protein KA005_34250 [bacterium]|nr:hypothetical protein [bacterium]